MDDGRLDERVAALERAITDGHAADGLPDAARMESRLADLEATVDDIDDRIADLEAAVQALRGFAGGVRAVDEAVERRANAAIARVDRLEAELQAGSDDDGANRRRAATEHDGADAETNVDPTDGVTARSANDQWVAESDDTVDAGPRPDRDETLHGAVTARSDAALAEVAASGDRSDESEDRSLADRLRRLL